MRRLSSVKIDRESFLGLGSFEFLTFMRRGVFYTFMIYYLYDLLGRVTIVALLGTFTAIASMAGQNFLWGRIADRRRLRTQLIVMGEITAGIAYILVYLSHKTLIDLGMGEAAGLAIIGGLSVLEFFWSMSDVGWATLVTDITTPEIRGGFIGVINFISSLGRMTGVLFAGFLYEGGLGFRNGTIFYVVTAMLFAGAAIMVYSSRMIKSNQRETKEYDTRFADITENSARLVRESEGPNGFIWFLISLIIIILGVASINQVFLLFLKLPRGLNATDEQVSLIVSAYTLGGMAASLLSGRLSDKFGRIRTISIGLLLAVLTLLIYGLVPNVEFMALVYGVNGVAFMTLQTGSFALAGDIIPKHKRARLLSRYNAAMALSWGPAGLLIGGPLADIQTGVLGISPRVAYINAFIVAAIVVSIGALVFLTKVKKPPHERVRNSA
jgi:MFS family permease